MVVYEVNLHVDNTKAEAFSVWLRNHIPEILAYDGFEGAVWYYLDPSDGRQHWTVHYRVRDWTALNHYFEHHAEDARQEGLDRFGGTFEADRRVLFERESFEAGPIEKSSR